MSGEVDGESSVDTNRASSAIQMNSCS